MYLETLQRDWFLLHCDTIPWILLIHILLKFLLTAIQFESLNLLRATIQNKNSAYFVIYLKLTFIDIVYGSRTQMSIAGPLNFAINEIRWKHTFIAKKPTVQFLIILTMLNFVRIWHSARRIDFNIENRLYNKILLVR